MYAPLHSVVCGARGCEWRLCIVCGVCDPPAVTLKWQSVPGLVAAGFFESRRSDHASSGNLQPGVALFVRYRQWLLWAVAMSG